jgi:hypothetical protein
MRILSANSYLLPKQQRNNGNTHETATTARSTVKT